MDYQITWSPEALDDIDDIAEFHHKKDPLYAQMVVEELVVRSLKLHYYPLRGRQVPELGAWVIVKYLPIAIGLFTKLWMR